MAVKIRLSRFGKTKNPHYRVCVVDERKKRDGAVIEYLGQYTPKKAEGTFSVKKDRIEYWISKGAQPTRVIATLLKSSK